MTVTLLTEHHFEFLRLTGGCTGLSESTPIKMPHCAKSHVATHFWMKDHNQNVQNISVPASYSEVKKSDNTQGLFVTTCSSLKFY